jgi:flagellar basal body-associated protein FliL
VNRRLSQAATNGDLTQLSTTVEIVGQEQLKKTNRSLIIAFVCVVPILSACCFFCIFCFLGKRNRKEQRTKPTPINPQ